MPDDGIQKAQEAIEERLQKEGQPVKARQLLSGIRDDIPAIRDIDLREAVWILIGRGKVSLTPDRELILGREPESTRPVN